MEEKNRMREICGNCKHNMRVTDEYSQWEWGAVEMKSQTTTQYLHYTVIPVRTGRTEMTNREAIETLEFLLSIERHHKEALRMAIEALEKQVPKKPKEYEDKYYACPVCGNALLRKWEKYPTKLMSKNNGLPYCLSCAQAIDWSEEK